MLRIVMLMMIASLGATCLYAAEAQDNMLEDLDIMEEAFSEDILPESESEVPETEPVKQFEEPVIEVPVEVWIEDKPDEIIETKPRPQIQPVIEESQPQHQPVIEEPQPVLEKQVTPVPVTPVQSYDRAERMPRTHATSRQPDPATLSIERQTGKMITLNTAYGTTFDVYAMGPVDAKAAALIVHDQWGLNKRVKAWVQRFAQRGYLTVAVDLYGGRTVRDEKSARMIMRSLDTEGVDAKFAGILEFISQSDRPVVIVGWGKGTQHALDITIGYPGNVAATVTYYSDSGDEDQYKLRAIKTPVLGVYTSLDIVGPPGSDFDYDLAEEAWLVTSDFLQKKFESSLQYR